MSGENNALAVYVGELRGTQKAKCAAIAGTYNDGKEIATIVRLAGMPFMSSLKAIFRAQDMDAKAAREAAEQFRDCGSRKDDDLSAIEAMRERIESGITYLEKVKDGNSSRSYIEKKIPTRKKGRTVTLDELSSVATKAHNDTIMELVASGILTEEQARERMR